MKLNGDRRLRLLFIYRSLIICLVILGLIFIGGTIYGVFFHQRPPDNFQVTISEKVGEGQTFIGIGQLRVSTADPQPGMVIIYVSFIYYPNDKAFSEELVLRVKDFRQIIVDYFGAFSVSELQALDEDSIKIELLRRFNAILRLGQIETLYFGDFMVMGQNGAPGSIQER